MPTFPSPAVPVFPAGFTPQAADFNGWWFNTASFLQTRVVFRALQNNTVTTLPSSHAAQVIQFDTVLEDPYSGWNSGTFLWQPPVGYSGWYHITFTLLTNPPPSLADLYSTITFSGTPIWQSATVQGVQANSQSGSIAGSSATYRAYMAGGQTSVGGYGALFNSASSVTTFSNGSGLGSTMEIVWIAS